MDSVILSGQDWKATLRLPPPDTRYQTAVWLLSSEFFFIGTMNLEDIGSSFLVNNVFHIVCRM